MEEWIIIIVIGFICISCPILILLYLEWMPWFVSVSFAIWILACIGTIVFSKGKEKKWYEKLIPSFVFTFIFTIIFMASMDTDHYMFDETIGLWVVAPTLSLPSFYLVGIWLNRNWLAKQEERKEAYNKSIDRQISNKCTEIQNLERSIKTRTIVTHLLKMLDYCGEDVSHMKKDPRVSNIEEIVSDIEQKHAEIVLLEKSKK